MITVILDARGQLTKLNFNTQKFRRIAPTELSSILVETISRAQAESRDQVLRAYQNFLPESVDVRGMMSGKTDINEMFEDAMRQADEMMADGKLRFPRPRSAGNGKAN